MLAVNQTDFDSLLKVKNQIFRLFNQYERKKQTERRINREVSKVINICKNNSNEFPMQYKTTLNEFIKKNKHKKNTSKRNCFCSIFLFIQKMKKLKKP